eukprot:SAG11_NODE_10298_length_841_cov_1.386792_2_plen_134_part_01
MLRHCASEAKAAATAALALEVLARGDSVVVSTCYRSSARSIQQIILASGGAGCCELLSGEVSQKQRALSVARFQAGESRAFVFTAGAGGVGITLTRAHDIILVDRALTPGDVEQAEDRVYRIGQKHEVICTWLR